MQNTYVGTRDWSVGRRRSAAKLGLLLWAGGIATHRIASDLSVESHPMRIAILQRDPLQRQTIEKILVQASHTCVTFDDGLSMSKALARSTVDMLVLDWHGVRLS